MSTSPLFVRSFRVITLHNLFPIVTGPTGAVAPQPHPIGRREAPTYRTHQQWRAGMPALLTGLTSLRHLLHAVVGRIILYNHNLNHDKNESLNSSKS